MSTPEITIQRFNQAAATVARTPPGKILAEVARRSSDCFPIVATLLSVTPDPQSDLCDVSVFALPRLALDNLSLVELLAIYATERRIGDQVVDRNSEFGSLKECVAIASTDAPADAAKEGRTELAGNAVFPCIREASNAAALSSILKKAVHRLPSSGTTAADVLADITSAVTTLAASPGSCFFLIVDPVTAARLALKSTPDGALAFPGVSLNGGQIGELIRLFVVDADQIPTPGDGSRKAVIVDAAGLVVDRGSVRIRRRKPGKDAAALGFDTERTFGLDQFRPAVAVIEAVYW
jgi:hypothetical protein